jgi:hypothetical protein
LGSAYYGIGAGFKSARGYRGGSDPLSSFVSYVRPPFSVNGTQFIRGMGALSQYPMPVGNEGNYFTVTDAINFTDSTEIAQVIAGGTITETLDFIVDSTSISMVDFAQFRIKSSSSKVRLIANISSSLAMRLKSSSSKVRAEFESNVISEISLKSSSSKIRIQGTLGINGSIRLRDSSSKIRIICNTNYTGSMRLKSSSSKIRMYGTITPSISDLNYTGVVMNTMLGAHTEYEDFGFNSFAFFNGKYYLASDDGLFHEREAVSSVINATANTVTVSNSANTFTRVSGSWLADGFETGDRFTTSGFAAPANNGTFLISNISALIVTVTTIAGGDPTLTNVTDITTTALTFSTEPILAYFKTGDIDSHRGTETIPYVLKREFDTFLGYEADGDMNLEVTGDRDGMYSYPITNERVMIGKGFNSRYYNFKVVNVNSAIMDFLNIRLKAVATRRKR